MTITLDSPMQDKEIVAPAASQADEKTYLPTKKGNGHGNHDLPIIIDNNGVDTKVSKVPQKGLIDLWYNRHYSVRQIAKHYKRSHNAIFKQIQRLEPLYGKREAVENYRKNEERINDNIKLQSAKQVVDEMVNTSAEKASKIYNEAFIRGRLIKNESTGNIAHKIAVTPELERMLKGEMIGPETQKAIESAHAEEAADDDEDF